MNVALDPAVHDEGLANEDLAPTTASQRTWTRWDIAALWVGMAICIPTYTLASGLVDKGWSWQAAVGSVALGNLVVLAPMVLNGHAGAKYGIPFPVLVRASFGITGANVPALLRAFVACGWFGIQTYIGGSALYTMLRVLLALPVEAKGGLGIGPLELACTLAFWALQVGIIWRGMETIRVLEKWSAPFLLAIGALLLGWAWWRTGSLDKMLENAPSSTVAHVGLGAVLGAGLTGAVSFWGTLALNIPDFSRFARSQRDQVIGQAVGLPATMAAFAFIGAAVTNATVFIFGARIADPVQLLGKIGGPAMTFIAMLALLIATLTTNLAANVVSPANDFSNVAPRKVSFKTGALLTAILGIVILPWKLYNDSAAYLFTWLLGYGAMLGSVGGVMIADYYVVRRMQLSLPDLYRRHGSYRFTGGVNVVALVALCAGIAPNLPGFLAALGVVDAGPLWATIYEWAWFVAFAIAFVTHLLGTFLLQQPKVEAP